jgi:hypothetical protein
MSKVIVPNRKRALLNVTVPVDPIRVAIELRASQQARRRFPHINDVLMAYEERLRKELSKNGDN